MNVVFGHLQTTLNVTLVSDGAECIRIRKNFFLKMTPQSLFDRLRREVIHIQTFYCCSIVHFVQYRFDLMSLMMNYRKNFNVKSIGQHINIC